jgi:hypothetical protein
VSKSHLRLQHLEVVRHRRPRLVPHLLPRPLEGTVNLFRDMHRGSLVVIQGLSLRPNRFNADSSWILSKVMGGKQSRPVDSSVKEAGPTMVRLCRVVVIGY